MRRPSRRWDGAVSGSGSGPAIVCDARTSGAATTVLEHGSYLLQELHNQRIQGLLCDCTLMVRGVCFKAHKNVLAAFSGHFRSLFQNSSSQRRDVFHIQIDSVGGIGQILDFMYTSHLELSQENVHAMLDLATNLQVQNIVNVCSTFLESLKSTEKDSKAEHSSGTLDTSAPQADDCIAEKSHLVHQTAPGHGQVFAKNKKTQVSSLLAHCAGDEEREESVLPNPSEATSVQNNGVECPGVDLSDGGALGSKQQGRSRRDVHPKKRELLEARKVSDLPPVQPVSPPKTVPSHKLRKPKEMMMMMNSNVTEVNGERHDCVVEGKLNDVEVAPANEQSKMKRMRPPKKKSVGSTYATLASDEPNVWLESAENIERASAEHVKDLPSATLTPKTQVQSSQSALKKAAHDDKETALTSAASEVHSVLISGEIAPDHAPVELQALSPVSKPSPEPHATGRQYFCEDCGKAFPHPSNLETHKRSHTGEKPYVCRHCGRKFSQGGNLKLHVRRHTGEKPFMCDVCGKRFHASSEAQRHSVIHTQEKPHVCDICGKGFSIFNNLKEHRQVHASDRPFRCDMCGMSFRVPRCLTRHRARHAGQKPHSCQVCGVGDLKRHMRMHTGERPYACDVCNKRFTRSAILRRHRAVHERDADADGAVACAPAAESLDPGASFAELFKLPAPVLVLGGASAVLSAAALNRDPEEQQAFPTTGFMLATSPLSDKLPTDTLDIIPTRTVEHFGEQHRRAAAAAALTDYVTHHVQREHHVEPVDTTYVHSMQDGQQQLPAASSIVCPNSLVLQAEVSTPARPHANMHEQPPSGLHSQISVHLQACPRMPTSTLHHHQSAATLTRASTQVAAPLTGMHQQFSTNPSGGAARSGSNGMPAQMPHGHMMPVTIQSTVTEVQSQPSHLTLTMGPTMAQDSLLLMPRNSQEHSSVTMLHGGRGTAPHLHSDSREAMHGGVQDEDSASGGQQLHAEVGRSLELISSLALLEPGYRGNELYPAPATGQPLWGHSSKQHERGSNH